MCKAVLETATSFKNKFREADAVVHILFLSVGFLTQLKTNKSEVREEGGAHLLFFLIPSPNSASILHVSLDNTTFFSGTAAFIN